MRSKNHDDDDAAAYKSLDDAPLILLLPEIARIYRLGATTIRRRVLAGQFRPKPYDVRPYRWRKVDVAADLRDRAGQDHTARPRPRRRRRAPVNGAPAAVAADQS
jgi:hypothetical protein